MAASIRIDAIREPIVVPEPIAVREWLPWMAFAGVLLMLALYFVGADQGATSLFGGSYVHEFVHDARHLIGFPCH